MICVFLVGCFAVTRKALVSCNLYISFAINVKAGMHFCLFGSTAFKERCFNLPELMEILPTFGRFE